jgi:hypothetical protein
MQNIMKCPVPAQYSELLKTRKTQVDIHYNSRAEWIKLWEQYTARANPPSKQVISSVAECFNNVFQEMSYINWS